MKRLIYTLCFIGLVSFGTIDAQSLTGTRGLIKSPTARMYESGTLAIGMGYVPSKFFKRTYGDYIGVRTGNSGLNTFVTVNLTSFIEVMFRYTHELNMEVNPITEYFPDRMFSARFKIIEESKNLPSILFGFQDISALAEVSCKHCSNFTSTYLVGSKKFLINRFNLDLSIGYATDILSLPAKDFKGIFGGIEIKYLEFDKAQLLLEYDTNSFNIGIQGYLFNRIHTVIGAMDLKPMFILAYRYKI